MARYSKSDLVEDLLLHEIFATTSKRKITDLIDDILQIISDKVVAGDEVAFAKFGKFYKFEKTKDGEPSGVIVPKFLAYGEFKDAVAG